MYNVKQKSAEQQIIRLEKMVLQEHKANAYFEEQASIYYNCISTIDGIIYDGACTPAVQIKEIKHALDILDARLNPRKVKKSENSY